MTQKPPSLGSAPASFAEAFRASMPAGYLQQQAEGEVREHADIAFRRGDALAHAELWRTRPNQAVVICLVTDDRPGLLSLVSAVIAAHGLDVAAAKVYTRKTAAGRAEAVDFFWLRRVDETDNRDAVTEDDVAKISAALNALLRGDMDLPEVIRRASLPPPAMGSPPSAHIHFAAGASKASVLVVEADDRPGLLRDITSALFARGVLIVDSEVATVEGRAQDRFHIVEANSEPLSPERRKEVEDAVVSALRAGAVRESVRPPRND